MDTERTCVINGHIIEEYWWAGKLIVYIDNKLFSGSYGEAQIKVYESGENEKQLDIIDSI
jgi:hypothetical protein